MKEERQEEAIYDEEIGLGGEEEEERKESKGEGEGTLCSGEK